MSCKIGLFNRYVTESNRASTEERTRWPDARLKKKKEVCMLFFSGNFLFELMNILRPNYIELLGPPLPAPNLVSKIANQLDYPPSVSDCSRNILFLVKKLYYLTRKLQ